MSYYEWPAYVSAAERKAKTAKHAADLAKKGVKLNPVNIPGRSIAKTFWGKAWCENLESYSDYSNRLPRGRTYARNGSIIDLQVIEGEVKAQVMGSSLYKISIKITPMVKDQWETLVKVCSGKIDSIIELLKGTFSKGIMELISRREGGLFPKPKEIKMHCSCPDSAGMCKHIAAVMYGIGFCLDSQPDWLFKLRKVDHVDLIASSSINTLMNAKVAENAIEEDDLSAIFGIEMAISDSKAAAPVTKLKAPKKKNLNPKPTVTKKIEKKTEKEAEKKKSVQKRSVAVVVKNSSKVDGQAKASKKVSVKKDILPTKINKTIVKEKAK